MHDPFDNGSQSPDLGVGRALPAKRCDADLCEPLLAEPLDRSEVRKRSRASAVRLATEDGKARACADIAALGR